MHFSTQTIFIDDAAKGSFIFCLSSIMCDYVLVKRRDHLIGGGGGSKPFELKIEFKVLESR
jgi:hypothetical protein